MKKERTSRVKRQRTSRIPAGVPTLSKKDFESDQDTRWCPGCGDYSILAQTQRIMPELGIPRENIGLYLRHRVFKSVPLLYEHLRLPYYPR